MGLWVRGYRWNHQFCQLSFVRQREQGEESRAIANCRDPSIVGAGGFGYGLQCRDLIPGNRGLPASFRC